jgi:hypothetical protein
MKVTWIIHPEAPKAHVEAAQQWFALLLDMGGWEAEGDALRIEVHEPLRFVDEVGTPKDVPVAFSTQDEDTSMGFGESFWTHTDWDLGEEHWWLYGSENPTEPVLRLKH